MSDVHEHAHHATEVSDKRIALLIAVLALLLAFAETGSKTTQTEALGSNIEASDLWAFYQAKTIRGTVLRTADQLASLVTKGSGVDQAAVDAQLREWRAAVAKLDSDPKSNEGRKELTSRAQRDERRRDRFVAANHQFELSSASFQIAIVLASATVITGVAALSWMAAGLGTIGGIFLLLALFAPNALPLF